MPGCAMVNARVCRCHANVSSVRVSNVVQLVPSLEPFTTQLVGSPAASDEVGVYICAGTVGPVSLYCSHGVEPASVTSVEELPSRRSPSVTAQCCVPFAAATRRGMTRSPGSTEGQENQGLQRRGAGALDLSNLRGS